MNGSLRDDKRREPDRRLVTGGFARDSNEKSPRALQRRGVIARSSRARDLPQAPIRGTLATTLGVLRAVFRARVR